MFMDYVDVYFFNDRVIFEIDNDFDYNTFDIVFCKIDYFLQTFTVKSLDIYLDKHIIVNKLFVSEIKKKYLDYNLTLNFFQYISK